MTQHGRVHFKEMSSKDVVKQFATIGRKIVAVGRNYKAHAVELGNPIPKVPMIFMKPTSSIIQQGQNIKIPFGCENLHQEVELAIVIGQTATKLNETNAFDCVAGYALALDMTARDFQDEAKKKGHPWILSKGFDTSCPVSGGIAVESVQDPHKLELLCHINGKEQQHGFTSDMIFSVPTVLQYITQYITLEAGDLVLTGTPEGVCRVNSGDKIECWLKQNGQALIDMQFNVE